MPFVFAQNLPAHADLDAGLRAVRIQDFSTAMSHLLPLANAGNPTAQYEVGVLYSNGDGVPQDLSEAAKWFRLAEGHGDLEAKNALAFLEALGIHEPPPPPPPPPPVAPAGNTPQSSSPAPDALPGSAPSAPGPHAMIQIASVQSEAVAIKEWHRLQKRHSDELSAVNPSVEPFTLRNKEVLYRVMAGPFDIESARAACVKLREKGDTCLVVRRD
ncbi:MAG: SPOR domain-containing protein [Alphaproteobacteria bacterium]|nr:SPOR domain-containing protein [Alphaproteobacteria bacterium]